jgi:quaternary ammonium compound-resistance protein SugE
MAWLFLIVAGLLEIGLVFSLKASHGFSRLWPSVLFLVFELTSFYLLSQALKSMPTGVAYVLWMGIGAVGTVIVGMMFFGEEHDLWRFISIGLIISGVIGLRLAEG